MATEVVTATTPGAQLDEMHTIFPYRAWQQREGIGRVEGYYVEDLATLPLNPWARKGTLGTFVNLEGTGGVINLATAKEQLLYEVTNPYEYVTPDVIADFTIGQDLIGLRGGLSFSLLEITQNTQGTIIKNVLTGEELGVMIGVSANSITSANFRLI